MSKVGIIEYDKLEIGQDLMKSNTHLREWRCPLPSLTKGGNMFSGCTNLTSFSVDLPSLTDAYNMFSRCHFNSFSSELPSLTQSGEMFYMCTALKSFSSEMPSLTYGYAMFAGCSSLNSFSSELSSLTYGRWMFKKCSQLESFTSDLSSLTKGEYMFNSCTALTTFNSNLSSLANGTQMFYGCNSLDTVTIKLKNLESADSMFKDCGSLKTLNLEYYDYAPSVGIDCREMFNGCDFRNLNLNFSLTNYKRFRVCDGRRMFGYPEEKDSNGNLTSNYVLNGEQWGKLIAGQWWLLGADNPRGAIFEATVDSNIMVPQSDGSIWCSATWLLRCGFRYFRIKYKDSNNKPVVVYGDKNMSPQYTFEKPDTAFWNTLIDDLSVAWVG